MTAVTNVTGGHPTVESSMDSYSIVAKLQPSGLREMAKHSEDYFLHFPISAQPIQVFNMPYSFPQEIAKMSCSNVDQVLPKQAAKALLRERLTDSSIESCADVADYCFGRKKFDRKLLHFIRALCPLSCGCTDPRAGSMTCQVRGDLSGCPRSCNALWTANLGKMSCSDAPISSDRFQVAVRETVSILVQEFKSTKDAAGFLREVQVKGCSLFSNKSVHLPVIGRMDACNPSELAKLWFGSFSPLCPITCNCSARMGTTGAPDCPRACVYNASSR